MSALALMYLQAALEMASMFTKQILPLIIISVDPRYFAVEFLPEMEISALKKMDLMQAFRAKYTLS